VCTCVGVYLQRKECVCKCVCAFVMSFTMKDVFMYVCVIRMCVCVCALIKGRQVHMCA
jgi:hypothetical protein